jgi:predicted small secreted protein
MDRFLRTLTMAAMAVMLSGFAIACNTVDGAGEDLKDASRETKDALD